MRGQDKVDKEQYFRLFLKKRVVPGVLGACIGDALGVPFEFKNRDYLKLNPVTGMTGYGTYNQPAGTWSDDSSLTFGLMESLINGYNVENIAENMWKYLHEAYWTPHGEVFDIGTTTRNAILKFTNGTPPLQCGGEDIYDNVNGLLMRIMPIVFYLGKNFDFDIKKLYTEQVSSITHRHPRSILACLIYVEFLQNIFANLDKEKAYNETIKVIKEKLSMTPYKEEMQHFNRILSGNIQNCDVDDIKSTGYVVDTLEACFWCFLTSERYKQSVLKAINLGNDTDTIGFLTGSLAGVYYKISNYQNL
ncbi:ADP-ribosylglycohydrolase family protein [Bacillaceae bacterium Marseille-Q3522]|nr:ADP-ribosylglycohydrolase family protein [Bacillaceae bacterium Marseille-Q3522]